MYTFQIIFSQVSHGDRPALFYISAVRGVPAIHFRLGLLKCFKHSRSAGDSRHFLVCKCLSHKGIWINVLQPNQGNDGEDNKVAMVNTGRGWKNDSIDVSSSRVEGHKNYGVLRDFVMHTVE